MHQIQTLNIGATRRSVTYRFVSAASVNGRLRFQVQINTAENKQTRKTGQTEVKYEAVLLQHDFPVMPAAGFQDA